MYSAQVVAKSNVEHARNSPLPQSQNVIYLLSIILARLNAFRA